MKKSEKYQAAMLAVLNSIMNDGVKLEVLELLMDNRGTALFMEKQEENHE